MTIQDAIKQYLVENGLFPYAADKVIEAVKADEGNECMATRWGDSTDDYPPIMIAAIMVTVKSHALAWIDANLPKAWFRPMFAQARGSIDKHTRLDL